MRNTARESSSTRFGSCTNAVFGKNRNDSTAYAGPYCGVLYSPRTNDSNNPCKNHAKPRSSLRGDAMLRPSVLVTACIWLICVRPIAEADCKPVRRYGVNGCEPTRPSHCPSGYDWIGVCPPNPKMKAPCVLMCVPRSKQGERRKVVTDVH